MAEEKKKDQSADELNAENETLREQFGEDLPTVEAPAEAEPTYRDAYLTQAAGDRAAADAAKAAGDEGRACELYESERVSLEAAQTAPERPEPAADEDGE